MQLSRETIEEFRQIHKEEFGEEVSDDEARRLGTDLLELFKIIYRPIPTEEKEGKKRGGDLSKS